MSTEVQESQKWKLHVGIHQGTLVSRDSKLTEHDSLEECRESMRKEGSFLTSMGYYIWFAYAFSPSGKKIILHQGTPYR